MSLESDRVISRDPRVAKLATDQEGYGTLVLDGRVRQSLTTVQSFGSRGLRMAVLETVDGLPAPAFQKHF